MSSTIGRSVVVPLTNKSGGGVIAGDVVVIDTTNNDAFTTSTAGAVTITVGVAQETIANNAVGRVLLEGYAALINVNASVTRGNYGKTHTVAKQATDAGASRVAGTFVQFLTGGTTPDGNVYPVDLAGAALTNPMTTSQDIIVGGSSGTPGRLAIGAAGGSLVSLNGVLAYDSGTSMPANKATGDRYWRTDLGMEVYWDGTRWLTTQLFTEPFAYQDGLAPNTLNGGAGFYLELWNGAYDIWIDRIIASTTVLTTNDGSHYWTVQFQDNASNNIGSSFNTSADTAGTNTAHTVTVGALTGTTARYLSATVTKTSTPGGLYLVSKVAYRLKVT